MDPSVPASQSTNLGIEQTRKVETVLTRAGLLHLKPVFVREKVRRNFRDTDILHALHSCYIGFC